MAPERGWYRLPRSGARYYGPVPEGAELADAPDAAEGVSSAVVSDSHPGPPPKGARVERWRAWAIQQGVDPDEASTMSKATAMALLERAEATTEDDGAT